MLLELTVRDFGIIERMSWSLSGGLNVITGETGAGKSLVIDAVEALLGGRIDGNAVRHGSDEAWIEGVFDLASARPGEAISPLLEERGISVDDDTLVMSCAVRRQGRATFRVNGQAVPRSLAHEIGRCFIDIHGQSEHLALLDTKAHLTFLDTYGDCRGLRDRFRKKLAEVHDIEHQMSALDQVARDAAKREDYLRYQVDEIGRAELREEEEQELEEERRILSSAEKLKSLAHEICQMLTAEELRMGSTIDRLHEARRMLSELAGIDPRLEQQAGLLEEAVYGIEELSRDVHSYGDALDFDPERLTEIESRLDQIRDLKRKYGGTIPDVLAHLDTARSELDAISHSTERRAELEKACVAVKREMGEIAAELSGKRAEGRDRLALAVARELDDLNMNEVRFDVALNPVNGADTIPLPDGRYCAYNSDGIDAVEFTVSTNPGEPPKPLARVASTGEVSRFMLALKGALSISDDIPVVIFDEIDIGVGGRAGEVLGKKLWALARNRQVICVTHLPQIAAFADAHYSVRKELERDRTISKLAGLDAEAHLHELAAMLAGPQYSNKTVASARELIDRARAWQESFADG